MLAALLHIGNLEFEGTQLQLVFLTCVIISLLASRLRECLHNTGATFIPVQVQSSCGSVYSFT